MDCIGLGKNITIDKKNKTIDCKVISLMNLSNMNLNKDGAPILVIIE